jgi:hypothetical protein
MWLPTHYTFSRNATYKALRRGKYQTIRMFTAPRNAMDDHANADLWIAPPPPPMQPYGASEGGGWVLPSVGTYPCHYNSSAATPGGTCGPARNSDEYFGNTVDQFSATCWYFGQSLHDLQEAAGEEPTPLGLIHSAWGTCSRSVGRRPRQAVALAAHSCRTHAKLCPSQLVLALRVSAVV